MLKIFYLVLAALDLIALTYLGISTRLDHPSWTETQIALEIGLQQTMLVLAAVACLISAAREFERDP